MKELKKFTLSIVMALLMVPGFVRCSDDKPEPDTYVPLAKEYLLPTNIHAIDEDIEQLYLYTRTTVNILFEGEHISPESNPTLYNEISQALGDSVLKSQRDAYYKAYNPRAIYTGDKLLSIKVKAAEDWDEIKTGDDFTHLFVIDSNSGNQSLMPENKIAINLPEMPLNMWNINYGTMMGRNVVLSMIKYPKFKNYKQWLKMEFIFEFEGQTLSTIHNVFLN